MAKRKIKIIEPEWQSIITDTIKKEPCNMCSLARKLNMTVARLEGMIFYMTDVYEDDNGVLGVRR